MTDSFTAWINPEQAIADHDADIREPLLARIAVLEGQVARVEALRVWSSDGGLTRRSIRAEHSERGDCVLVEDIEQALAAPADTEGVSRESIEQVRWAEANPDAMALDDVEAARRDAAEGGE